MEPEYNPNINIQTATTDELIIELMILEDYTEPEARTLYNSIQTELDRREANKQKQDQENQEHRKQFNEWLKNFRASCKSNNNQANYSPYARPDRMTIDGKPF